MRLPVEGEFSIIDETVRFTYRATREDLIGRRLYWRGYRGFEAATLSVLKRLFIVSSTFCDVGANTGFYSVYGAMCNHRLRIGAFEPVPRVYERLLENVMVNGLTARISAFAVAVGNREGRAGLHVPFEKVPTSASLDPKGFRGLAGSLIDVPITTLDRVRAHFGQVDLIKIDVEGFELDVLEGAARTIEEDRPVIVLECHPGGRGEELSARLKKHQYDFYVLRGKRPKAVSAIGLAASATEYNYACVPREKTRMFADALRV